MFKPRFGRLIPKPEMVYSTNKYAFSWLGIEAPDDIKVEKIFDYPKSLIDAYDQEGNSCVGNSISWYTSTMNSIEKKRVIRYDANWLYWEAQRIDGDPNTIPYVTDNGAYLFSGFDVLRISGHRIIEKGVSHPPSLDEGIYRYYWCYTIKGIETAFHFGRPVVLGIGWYEDFMNPELYNGEWWIGRNPYTKWGRLLGGHAIFMPGLSYERNAGLLLGSWGDKFPPVWISKQNISWLIAMGGECAVGVDKRFVDKYKPKPRRR